MPFVCHYCKGTFCAEHRLPERHSCPNLWMAKPPGAPVLRPRAQARRPIVKLKMSGVEVRHLLIAWLVLGFAFSLVLGPLSAFPIMFPISLGTVGLAFIVHELSHKFIAQRYGCWAEFRMWPWGLMMALLFALISATIGGFIIFAAPGATYIAPKPDRYGWDITKRENGLIALLGPLTNIALAMLFYLLFLFSYPYTLMWLVGFMGSWINLWLAAFNMLPFGGLDGQKVLSWSLPIWAVVAIPLWIWVFLFMF